MSIKPLPESLASNQAKKHNSIPQPLSQRFFRTAAGWFVNHNDGIHGPYMDKAEAQTALMYFSLRTSWPDEKQLREFVRDGK